MYRVAELDGFSPITSCGVCMGDNRQMAVNFVTLCFSVHEHDITLRIWQDKAREGHHDDGRNLAAAGALLLCTSSRSGAKGRQ